MDVTVVKPAPGQLALVQAFVNTHDYPGKGDLLADAGEARQWLASVLRPGARLDESALARLRTLREALRLTLLSHAGHA